MRIKETPSIRYQWEISREDLQQNSESFQNVGQSIMMLLPLQHMSANQPIRKQHEITQNTLHTHCCGAFHFRFIEQTDHDCDQDFI